jgi:peptidoglycan/LPS O-acetylase OafA/YrhL
MLSMFLLLHSLDSNQDLKHYFWRRIKRIWPIYYGLVMLAFLIYHISVGNLLQYLTFTQYWVTPLGGGVLTVFWTLQLEEAMYLFIPLIHRTKHKLSIAWILIAINLLTSVLFSAYEISPAISQALRPLSFLLPYINTDAFFLEWLAAYGVGILAYVYRQAIPKFLIYLAPIALAGIALCVALGVPELNFVFRQTVYFLILPGFAALLVHPPRFLRYFAILGEESYGMYALQYFFLFPFGLAGVPLILVTAFAVEFALRPRNIYQRLRIAYWEKSPGTQLLSNPA